MSRSSVDPGHRPLGLEKRSLADLAADQLRAAILAGEFAPGARLVETDLAARLGVSRGTVRSALAVLHRDGLVVCERYSAWSVAVLDRTALWEIYTMRAALESAAARLAAARIAVGDDEARALIEAVRAAEERLGEAERTGDAAARREADLAFHRLIVERAGNRLLSADYATILDKVRWIYAVSERRAPGRIDLREWHKPLADALCAGNARLAGECAFELCAQSLSDDLQDLAPDAPGASAEGAAEGAADPAAAS